MRTSSQIQRGILTVAICLLAAAPVFAQALGDPCENRHARTEDDSRQQVPAFALAVGEAQTNTGDVGVLEEVAQEVAGAEESRCAAAPRPAGR